MLWSVRSKVDDQRQGGSIGDPEPKGGMVPAETVASKDADDDQAAHQPPRHDRRKEPREDVYTSVEILLINVGSRLRGRILDLSLGGCRIRTIERFPVGIYTRVEVGFRMEGLPFRLGGVIQAIHDHKTVGIRFLDVSERKRKEVLELIGEIAELHPANTSVDPAVA
jgi:PilZ domain-containing protein